MTSPSERVLWRTEKHKTDWRERSQWYWLLCLIEEVVELALALAGLHNDPVGLELEEIASICLNWLDMRSNSQSK